MGIFDFLMRRPGSAPVPAPVDYSRPVGEATKTPQKCIDFATALLDRRDQVQAIRDRLAKGPENCLVILAPGGPADFLSFLYDRLREFELAEIWQNRFSTLDFYDCDWAKPGDDEDAQKAAAGRLIDHLLRCAEVEGKARDKRLAGRALFYMTLRLRDYKQTKLPASDGGAARRFIADAVIERVRGLPVAEGGQLVLLICLEGNDWGSREHCDLRTWAARWREVPDMPVLVLDEAEPIQKAHVEALANDLSRRLNHPAMRVPLMTLVNDIPEDGRALGEVTVTLSEKIRGLAERYELI